MGEGRRKHSNEFKLQVVQAYEKGEGGYKHLAKKYGITYSLVQKWVNQYREFGTEALFRSRTYRKYSLEFKLKALQMHETSEKSYVEIANELGMKNPSHIAIWKMQYRHEGIGGLSKKRGGSAMSAKEKPGKKHRPSNKPPEDEKDKRIKELENELRLLKIKNEYLELLRSLRQEETKKKQESSSSSENATD